MSRQAGARLRQALLLLATLGSLPGCASSLEATPDLPLSNAIVREQLVIHSDSPLPTHHRLFEDLTAQRTELVNKLALPTSDEPIHVYLFETPQRFNNFLRTEYPGLPERRAFFVEGDTQLAVYAQWGDRVAEDLRHEVAHGYLHAVVPRIPLWLDEGLAEYFEVPRGTQGVNLPHVKDLTTRLAAGGWRPDLRRLEGLAATDEMTQADYAESWAWVHWMLEGKQQDRRAMLSNYLNALRTQETAEPLSMQLANQPSIERQLADHIFSLSGPR